MKSSDFLKVLEDLIEMQQQLLLKRGQRMIPNLTMDDILQPNDYPSLENDPLFRYEEGVLAGLLSAKIACVAAMRESQGSDMLFEME